MGLVKLLDLYNEYGSNYSYNTPSSMSDGDVAAILGGVLAGLGIAVVFILALAVLIIIAKWKLFKKMGIDGWKSLINTVNTYLQMEATGVDQRWFLVYIIGALLMFIPILNIVVIFLFVPVIIYFWILYNVSLAKSFGKSTGFAVGLILASPIFLCILAFGDSQYIGPNPMNDILFKNNKPTEQQTINPASTANSTYQQGAEVSENQATCPNCGAPVQNGTKFCTKCGQQL